MERPFLFIYIIYFSHKEDREIETFEKNTIISKSLRFNFQAAWGGGLLFSKKYRQTKFKGIER